MTEATMSSRRLAVYTDYAYTIREGEVYAERAFALFMMAVLAHAAEGTVIGRLRPSGGQARYRLGDGVSFVALPYYADGSRASSLVRAFAISFRRLWRSLDSVDTAWILGPHGLAIPFALLVLARRRRLRLGVRQDLRAYARSRHPRRRIVHRLADILEWVYRMLARRYPVVVVGEGLRESYSRGRAVLATSVSLVADADIVSLTPALEREWGDRLIVLSVGRLDAEKNPLLLIDIIGALVRADSRWQLTICGEGPLEAALAERVVERRLDEHVQIRGYVPFAELREVYRTSHVFMHVSLTEGLPQVLFEAFAAGLPVVATEVGGVRAAADGAAMLVAANRVPEAVSAITCLQRSPRQRAELVAAGIRVARAHTLEREAVRVATFLLDGDG
ncbi:MAG TPA: glycosyltransferase family 4 protein [Solirubrobacteraceae bacterium]|nr:glycosyltransferase family 4 protein [Solirubrobacteraceae bacterium]